MWSRVTVRSLQRLSKTNICHPFVDLDVPLVGDEPPLLYAIHLLVMEQHDSAVCDVTERPATYRPSGACIGLDTEMYVEFAPMALTSTARADMFQNNFTYCPTAMGLHIDKLYVPPNSYGPLYRHKGAETFQTYPPFFYDISPCSPYANRRFGATYHLHLQCYMLVSCSAHFRP
jgi:hypothetical protein